jgi:SHS2 domain-containing protein
VRAAGHREIDHTADLGFEIWAPTPEELYAEGVLAIAEVCYDRTAVQPSQQRPLSARGSNPEERLVRWLQEVYLMLETDMWLTAAAIGVTISDDVVEGVLQGEPFDAKRHTIHTEIKAITYHGLRVENDGKLWRATVVVDV